jgi:hypothetical protein
MVFVDPLRERQTLYFLCAVVMMVALFSFRIFGAAVFAEPTIAQIEEVCGLMHLEKI